MKRLIIAATAVFFILSGVCQLAIAAPGIASGINNDGWEFVKEKKGVALYKKDMPGSNYTAFKAKTVVNSTMAAIGAVLRDVPQYPQWMAKIAEARVLKQYDANNMDAYLVMDFPWPTADRDVVVNGATTIDPATGNVTVVSRVIDDPAMPEKEGLVRVPALTQQFVLAYKDFDTTEISFSLHLEAGGNLPAFTVNPATQSVPYDSLQQLSKVARGEKYRDADPLNPINIPITKTIITAVLGNYITDKAIIEMVISDNDLMDIAIRGGFSEKGVRNTATAIVKKYVKTPMYAEKIKASKDSALLARLSTDEALLKKLAEDDDIAEMVISTGGMTDQVIHAITAGIKDSLD